MELRRLKHRQQIKRGPMQRGDANRVFHVLVLPVHSARARNTNRHAVHCHETRRATMAQRVECIVGAYSPRNDGTWLTPSMLLRRSRTSDFFVVRSSCRNVRTTLQANALGRSKGRSFHENGAERTNDNHNVQQTNAYLSLRGPSQREGRKEKKCTVKPRFWNTRKRNTE